MFKKTDPNTFTKFCDLKKGTDIIGGIYLEYQVTLYEDVQSNGPASVIKSKDQKFIVNCTQRINIYNHAGMTLQPTENLTAYDNYPAMINTSIGIIDEDPSKTVLLLDYSPQTINTQIESSGTTGNETGVTNGSSTSSTTGSSISQTNSYGGSVTVGDSFSGASSSYEHSSTVTKEHSNTVGSDSSNSNNSNASKSASMSIKDWGAYGMVNPITKKTAWTFGQEYPWDAIVCKNATAKTNSYGQTQLVIPTSMLVRLYDGVTLYPPSELSIFGINFVMKSSMLVSIADNASADITLEHIVNYFSASHMIPADPTDVSVSAAAEVSTAASAAKVVSVYIDKEPYVLTTADNQSLSTTIDLNFMALSPLGLLSTSAIIGFIPNKFIVQPVSAKPATADAAATAYVPFKIISTTNDLMIQDTTSPLPADTDAGFSASQTSLTATFSNACQELDMTMYFKVIDSVANYTLYMKHWKTKAAGVMLTIVINEDVMNPIVKYVDALEAEGGENNLLSIALRNQDFASIDYHDYLQLGLNSIQIKIAPIDGNYADCVYQIRAVSIENV